MRKEERNRFQSRMHITGSVKNRQAFYFGEGEKEGPPLPSIFILMSHDFIFKHQR